MIRAVLPARDRLMGGRGAHRGEGSRASYDNVSRNKEVSGQGTARWTAPGPTRSSWPWVGFFVPARAVGVVTPQAESRNSRAGDKSTEFDPENDAPREK